MDVLIKDSLDEYRALVDTLDETSLKIHYNIVKDLIKNKHIYSKWLKYVLIRIKSRLGKRKPYKRTKKYNKDLDIALGIRRTKERYIKRKEKYGF